MTYEAAKKRAAPYDKIVGELPEMRAETVDLVKAGGEPQDSRSLLYLVPHHSASDSLGDLTRTCQKSHGVSFKARELV